MSMFFTAVVLVFVCGVLLALAYSLFELSPYAHHKDHYRDPETGERRWESPNLERR